MVCGLLSKTSELQRVFTFFLKVVKQKQKQNKRKQSQNRGICSRHCNSPQNLKRAKPLQEVCTPAKLLVRWHIMFHFGAELLKLLLLLLFFVSNCLSVACRNWFDFYISTLYLLA